MNEAARHNLLKWYEQNAEGRELPWRMLPPGRRDAYVSWLAEVMLQQTQASRGVILHERFLKIFPTVDDLAKAEEDAVLKAWEGCGYYARARNLHRAAKIVAREGFPQSHADWLALPGVGPYIAAALASLVNGEDAAAVDGNIRRVLSRFYAEKEPSDAWLKHTAAHILLNGQAGAWNEALMDLGATICTPKNPSCDVCPLQAGCAAAKTARPSDFPAPKKAPKQREVQRVALVIGNAERATFVKNAAGRGKGLFALPSVEIRSDEAAALEELLQHFSVQTTPLFAGEVRHVMTGTTLLLRVYHTPAAGETAAESVALGKADQKALALLRRGPLFEA